MAAMALFASTDGNLYICISKQKHRMDDSAVCCIQINCWPFSQVAHKHSWRQWQTETQYSMGPREGATHPFPIRGKGGLPPPATKTQTRHSPHHVCVGPPMYTCLGGGPVLETETATDWPLPSPANRELKLLSILGRCLSLQTRPAMGGIGPKPKPNGPGGESMAGGKNSKTGPGPIGLAIILLARGFPRVFKRLGLRSSHCYHPQ